MEAKGKRAFWGACLGMIANMGLNTTFTLFLVSFVTTWPEAGVANIALAATFGCLAAALISTFLAGRIFAKIDARNLFLICAILGAIYCLIHFASTAVWQLIVAGLLGGTTLAIGTHAAGVTAVSPYLGVYKNPGTTISIVMSCCNIGAVVISVLVSQLLGGGMFWRNAYLVVGAVVVILDLLAFFLVPKTERVAAPAGADPAAAAAAAAPEQPGMTVSQALKTPAFWLLFFGIAFIAIHYQGVCTYFVTYLTLGGLSQSAASNMQAVMQGVGILFVAFGGVIIQKLGTKGLFLATVIPMFIGTLLLAYGFPKSASIGIAVLCAILLVTGALVTNICPLVTPVMFGPKQLNQINPIYAGGAFWGGTTLASQVVGRVVGATGSYGTGFVVAGIIGVVGLVLLFIALGAKPKWEEA